MGAGASTNISGDSTSELVYDGETELFSLEEVTKWIENETSSTSNLKEFGLELSARIKNSGKTPIEVMHHIKQGDLVDALQIPLSSDEIKKQARQLLQNARKSLRKEFLVTLKQLPDAMDKAVYVMEKYPLIVDPSGHATRYLKYQRGSFLMAGNPSDMDLKCLRRNLVGALKHGTLLIICFDSITGIELDQFFSDDSFPAAILNRNELFMVEVYSKLLRKDQGDPDPEDFLPNDQFKFVVICSGVVEPPPETALSMCVLRVRSDEEAKQVEVSVNENDPVAMALGVKEVKRNSLEIVEAAFDNELDTIKKLLDKGYHIESEDGHGHSALSEASCQGHDDIVAFLLEQGADPNKLSDQGKSPLYRAAYNGHLETVQLLIKNGADPRLVSKQGEKPFDVAKTREVQLLLSSCDLKETDKLLDKRRKVIEAKWQERISSHVEREKIALMKIHQELVELANKGETEELIKLLEALAEEAVDTKERPRGFADTRDERGSTLLAIAAQHDHHEIAEFLLTRSKLLVEQAKQIPREAAERQEKIAKILKANPNARDCRGWTPASIAVFHESKRSLRLLLDNGADPKLVNQYNKNAYDFAKDDLDAANCVVKSRQEIRQVLFDWENEHRKLHQTLLKKGTENTDTEVKSESSVAAGKKTTKANSTQSTGGNKKAVSSFNTKSKPKESSKKKK